MAPVATRSHRRVLAGFGVWPWRARDALVVGAARSAREIAVVLVLYADLATRRSPLGDAGPRRPRSRSLGLAPRTDAAPPERVELQRAVLPHRWLASAANAYYAIAHVPALVAIAVWLFVRHRDRYPEVRNVLAIAARRGAACSSSRSRRPACCRVSGSSTRPLATTSRCTSRARAGLAGQLSAMPSIHVRLGRAHRRRRLPDRSRSGTLDRAGPRGAHRARRRGHREPLVARRRRRGDALALGVGWTERVARRGPRPTTLSDRRPGRTSGVATGPAMIVSGSTSDVTSAPTATMHRSPSRRAWFRFAITTTPVPICTSSPTVIRYSGRKSSPPRPRWSPSGPCYAAAEVVSGAAYRRETVEQLHRSGRSTLGREYALADVGRRTSSAGMPSGVGRGRAAAMRQNQIHEGFAATRHGERLRGRRRRAASTVDRVRVPGSPVAVASEPAAAVASPKAAAVPGVRVAQRVAGSSRPGAAARGAADRRARGRARPRR